MWTHFMLESLYLIKWGASESFYSSISLPENSAQIESKASPWIRSQMSWPFWKSKEHHWIVPIKSTCRVMHSPRTPTFYSHFQITFQAEYERGNSAAEVKRIRQIRRRFSHSKICFQGWPLLYPASSIDSQGRTWSENNFQERQLDAYFVGPMRAREREEVSAQTCLQSRLKHWRLGVDLSRSTDLVRIGTTIFRLPRKDLYLRESK